MNSAAFEAQSANYVQQVERALEKYAQLTLAAQSTVSEAARYSLFAGGKRVRGSLVLAFCDMCGGDMAASESFVAAVEMVHAYSLIHDDLPCMDDDDMRRGKPACHIKFGEANALLAGDALLTAAFAAIANGPGDDTLQAKALKILSEGAGARGMIYGQELDLHFETIKASYEELLQVHNNKTGALITAAALMGALGVEDDKLDAVRTYGQNIGLVFQIVDDILDVTADSATLGKPKGSDAQQGKTTFTTLFGTEEAFKIAKDLTDSAAQQLQTAFGDKAQFLIAYAENLLERQK